MKFFEWIALIGAFAWLPHLIIAMKDFFIRPQIRIITEKKAELGFTFFGSIINLRLAFAVKKKELVISGVKIQLTHQSGERRTFEWQGIVQNILQVKNPEYGEIPLEKESSVLAIKLNLKEIEERFIRFQEPKYHESKNTLDLKIHKKLIYLQESGQIDYESFLSSEEMTELVSFIKQSFNWRAGRYTARFEVESPDQFTLIDNQYSFELLPMDINTMEKNTSFIEKHYEQQFIKNNDSQEIIWRWIHPIFKKLK